MIDLSASRPDAAARFRFVSDIHLGNPGAVLKTERDFSGLVRGCDVLVVCGDFMEARPCRYAEEATRQRTLFERICGEEGVELVLLCGNHDPEQREAVATMYGGRFVALHGHEVFPEVAPWGREYLYNKKLARKVIAQYPRADVDLDQCLERTRAMSLFVPPVIRRHSNRKGVLDLFKNACWPPTRAFRILYAWATMVDRIEAFTDRFFPEAQVVCYGHFHRRNISVRKGRLYVNTGALFKHAKAYAVDVIGNRVEIFDVSAGGIGRRVREHSLTEYHVD